MDPPKPSPIRVLTRPTTTPPTPPPLPQGVVVVGFLSATPTPDVAHLINRILDADVFGNQDRDFNVAGDWFRDRRVSYYHLEEKGFVFVRFEGSELGADRVEVEEREADDLRGFLFLFSVCHVIIFLHEGLHFHTHILKKLRMLQGAKNALVPFIRSQVTPTVASKASPGVSQPSVRTTSSRSPVRGGNSSRGSSVSRMSGSGSHQSVMPGQCVPIVLFVFHNDILDGTGAASSVEDIPDASQSQTSGSGAIAKPAFVKGFSSVVMLTRPTSRNESGLRKKISSALDSQIRILIKKCRILVNDSGGSRGGSPTPLFSLDTSRSVALLDKSKNCSGKSIDFASSLIEDMLDSEVHTDALVLDEHGHNSNAEDIQSIKDFIYRQSDSLRGKGALHSNAGSGSTSGVGMVAAAAAAAAASAGAGKLSSSLKFPDVDNWVSSSKLILETLVSASHQPSEVVGNVNIRYKKNTCLLGDDKRAPVENNAAEAAISFLESSRGLNLKFSMSWCQRALPAALEVYLETLPSCYPTSVHVAQLQKALHAFQRMVKGPAVPLFLEKLEDKCNSIWKSGRQLCDAISLTGKPCMHQRHVADSVTSSEKTKQHSSGYVFLHACACGRSRRLREDPFDFDVANVSFNCFPNCEKFLPLLTLPKGCHSGPLSSSWSLARLGGPKYYEPSKGLIQTGFCYPEKYLSRWVIELENKKDAVVGVTYVDALKSRPGAKVHRAHPKKQIEIEKVASDLVDKANSAAVMEVQETKSVNSNVHFGNSLPPVIIRKAFSEVVAGTASIDSSFPPLQQKKQSSPGPQISKQVSTGHQGDQAHLSNECSKSDELKHAFVQGSSKDTTSSPLTDGPSVQMVNNAKVNMHTGVEKKENGPAKGFSIYYGFEHECPHGHRFLLSMKHLDKLDSEQPGKERPETLDVLEENFPNGCLNGIKNDHNLLNRDLPIYMRCPHCENSTEKRRNMKFANSISQLQRIFLVTPPFPVVIATCPIIQFAESCLPPSAVHHEKQSRFSVDSRVILPPESFLSFRLPFVYGVELDGQDLHLQPLNFMEQHPEQTAWLVRGTAFQVVSKGVSGDGS